MIYHLPTILVIDDDPIVRQTIKALLTGDDVRLVFAEDGKSGIEIAQKLQPDAILLDVMMPGMNGYEVCQILRQDPNLNEVHIVMLTSLDDRDARLTGFMAGVDDFITKPFDRLELHLRLKTITRINRYRRLMAERARFSWIVENNNDGYLLLSSDGIIQYANSSAQNFLHLPHECAGSILPAYFKTLFPISP
jgi:DNA-binding response OmpR family regulator